MVAGNLRSRRLRRIHVTTPGGRSVIHYKERKPSHAQCGRCGMNLHGVARVYPAKIRGLSKTERRPTRPFGGSLCSGCTREEIIKRSQ